MLPQLPVYYVMISVSVVNTLPHFGAHGCKAIGVVPEDRRQGISAPVPEHFNTLPTTLPGYD